MPRKCVEFFLRVVDLAGGRKSTGPVFRLYGASRSAKKCYMNTELEVAAFCKFPLIKTVNIVCEKRYYHCILTNHDKRHLTGE